MTLNLSRANATRWVWRWGPALAWLGFIFAMSAQSHPPFVPGGDGIPYLLRKLGHFTEFAILAGLMRRALAPRSPWLAFALSALYAASDEWHQSFVPGRDMLFSDWGIDVAGVAGGLGLIEMFERRVRQK